MKEETPHVEHLARHRLRVEEGRPKHEATLRRRVTGDAEMVAEHVDRERRGEAPDHENGGERARENEESPFVRRTLGQPRTCGGPRARDRGGDHDRTGDGQRGPKQPRDHRAVGAGHPEAEPEMRQDPEPEARREQAAPSSGPWRHSADGSGAEEHARGETGRDEDAHASARGQMLRHGAKHRPVHGDEDDDGERDDQRADGVTHRRRRRPRGDPTRRRARRRPRRPARVP